MATGLPAGLVEDMVAARWAWTGWRPALERILAGGSRGRTLVQPGR